MAEKRTALQVDMERIKSELHQTNLDEDAGTPPSSPNGSESERLDAPEQSTSELGENRKKVFSMTSFDKVVPWEHIAPVGHLAQVESRGWWK